MEHIVAVTALEILEIYLSEPEAYYNLHHYRECHGIMETRDLILKQAEKAWRAFEKVSEENNCCFDYEILPEAMALVYARISPISWTEAMALTVTKLNAE